VTMTTHGTCAARTTLTACTALLALACGGDSTTGRQVTLHTEVRADVAPGSTFTSETGWTITLSRAVVSVGALYYFDGAPALVRREDTWREELRGLFGARRAYAHPGHYLAGDALGQMTTPAVITLAGEPAPLADGVGITGTARSARVVLASASGSDALPEGVVAVAEGVAEQGDLSIHFRLEASADEVAGHATGGEVDGCVFDTATITRSGTVTMTVLPHVWFDLVDFSDLAPGSAQAPTELSVDETARIAFVLGVVQLSAYRFTFE
jgi:hypothetical protein